MLHIAGGTYLECCDEPYCRELYGSGFRAAVSLSNLIRDIELSTYYGEKDHPSLLSIAASHGFKFGGSPIPQTVGFHYTHGLSTPTIHPHPVQIEQIAPLTISSETVLRFGFIEGDAIVHGETVVYDPQSTYSPKPFSENGSTAKRLALVTNVNEAANLTGESDVSRMADRLLSSDNAEAVVIKQGAKGALVATSAGREMIPVYETDFVWPLGTGDVFTASFTYHWAKEGESAPAAADLASRAVAAYCNGRALPLPKNYLDVCSFRALGTGVDLSTRQVYLAGPFFNMAQRWLINESLIQLKAMGMKVFSPLHDIGVGCARDIYAPDILGLKNSDIVFACLDNLDAGTLFEIGYAVAEGIPVVVYVQGESEGDLKMIDGSPCIVCHDFCTAIYKTAWMAVNQ